MFKFEDYKVQERNFEKFYADNERITHKKGFMLAAGLVSGSEKNIEIPKEVGSFWFFRKSWKSD